MENTMISKELQEALGKLENIENVLEKLIGCDYALNLLIEEHAKIRVEIALLAADLHQAS